MDRATKVKRAYILATSLQKFGVGWSFSTYVLFLLGQGMTLFEANLLNTGFMVASFLLDPPTGYLGDRIGQRRIYLVGQLFWAISMLVYGTSTTFAQFLAAELAAAIGSALISGALDSWMRNQVGEAETHKALSQGGSISQLVSIPAAVGGGFIGALYGLDKPWLIGSACSFAALVIAYLALRGFASHEKKEDVKFAIRGIARHSMSNPALRFTIIIAFFQTLLLQPFNMFWAPIFKELSGETWWLGSFWVGITLAIATGSHLAQGKLQQLNGKGIALALFAIGLPMLFTPFGRSTYIVAGLFLIHEGGRGAVVPLIFTYANRHIPDEVRSTSNSIRSSASTLGAGIGLVTSGYLTFFLSPIQIWGIASAGIILLSLYAIARKE
ncbi:MAG: hypothetical protein A3D24_02210 [Candidatus Blackburnbacteria bacterium RIFCSPHIGHO2_02_FULL_39_13]|uniref:Major facilitator superfamily (MFS) profile domain-containing protein n=1 Tax=Candidatus Blackburnbacteria bacterium RIFCSPLOWO2_01_FULL_40_20 TaxID=1797519 RepID=A0A1G1VDF6_9BACT|nr:MAG: hypothetical protein A2694_03910 [Candidatus Blackburnbacteria bacterium RIFCSPHIGHO2_01_FULL_40_17]OGY09209.1 MAG: hypothetical protein A3D24_02210 [Candidatus Blackburnbacteria bacterium RIFCSPHIGHO2_02_FULL_39_13]OGY13553.1 MAG: hypothetical protein A3A77_04145 [Candidatus Blackburnbacteria bacterium RIFCSPLOWO2_01_FULL_40_20]HBL52205.1 hypothetical protein [Candidatus Blackburnbacteria bacterium]